MNAIYLRVVFHDLIIPVIHVHGGPITVAERSKVWVCGRSLGGTAVSNPVGDMEVCLLLMLCVVRYRSLRRADHWF